MSQCGCDACDQQRELTLNGVQVCSVLHVAHVVLCVVVLVGVVSLLSTLVMKMFLSSYTFA